MLMVQTVQAMLARVVLCMLQKATCLVQASKYRVFL